MTKKTKHKEAAQDPTEWLRNFISNGSVAGRYFSTDEQWVTFLSEVLRQLDHYAAPLPAAETLYGLVDATGDAVGFLLGYMLPPSGNEYKADERPAGA